MGSKNRHTARAKQQERLDDLRAQITTWYLDERLTSLDIQKRLRAYGLDLTVGQVHYAFHRFGLKRDRNVRSEKLLAALRDRKHPSRSCRHCDDVYVPTSGAQVYCDACAPSPSFCRRIQKYGIGKKEFDVLRKAQDGKCGICTASLDDESAAVDHDHMTLQVRGLLCRPCNLKLAVVEDVDFIVRARAYLECSSKVAQGKIEAT
jgi:hypothetical protein